MNKAEPLLPPTDLTCPQCGIPNADRKPPYRIQDLGMAIAYCPICGYAWRVPEPEAHRPDQLGTQRRPA